MTTSEAEVPGAPREVYVVIQTKANPTRDVVVAVCTSRERADRYVATESHDGDMRIEPQRLLN